MAVRMVMAGAVAMFVIVTVVTRRDHAKTLYYNITSAKSFRSPKDSNRYGLPMTMAMPAARNGNGIETAVLNQTNRAGFGSVGQAKRGDGFGPSPHLLPSFRGACSANAESRYSQVRNCAP